MNPEPNELYAFFASIDEFLNGIEPWFSLEEIQAFANSAFTTSLVGALAGAFAGAYMAQRIAERGKLREELQRELRSVNAAMALAVEIVNTGLALKKQYVSPLTSSYLAERARYQEYSAKRATGQIQGNMPFPLQVDFRNLPTISTPVQMLQDLMFGKISATGRPLNLTASLTEALRSLNEAIARRNEFVENFKVRQFPPGADVASIYLDQENGDAVTAISSLANDVIFFGHLLCRDLRDYGQEVSERLGKVLVAAPVRVYETDFAKAKAENLIPRDEDYASWFSAFLPPPKQKRRWWNRAA